MTEEQINRILIEYSANDMAKLKTFCRPFISKFGGLSEMDMDEFYSQANETLWTSAKDFDESYGCTFEQYLASCVQRKFKTIMTGRNRDKRIPQHMMISLDETVDETGTEMSELIGEEDVRFDHPNERFAQYYQNLTKTQQDIVKLMLAGLEKEEIVRRLNLAPKKFDKLYADLSSIKRRIGSTPRHERKDRKEAMNVETTFQKSKRIQYGVSDLIDMIDNEEILFGHPAQRESEQWSKLSQSNLISDILQNNPIPAIILAEQNIGGQCYTWDIDGKQRCMTLHKFRSDNLKISRNIRRYEIKYQVIAHDENGNVINNSFGTSAKEWVTFDIRGKSYSQLPAELRKIFDRYAIEATLYLNCSDDDIVYHIERYNDGRPMNNKQKAVTELGTDFAAKTKEISNMDFFKENEAYTKTEEKNGTMERIVIESIMAMNYLDSWKKELGGMSQFLKENGCDEDFEALKENVEYLDAVVEDDVRPMFNSRDSFIWFAVYSRFASHIYERDDRQFIDFMRAFRDELHSREINGVSYDNYAEKATKDKFVVQSKIQIIETLMYDYLDDHGGLKEAV